MYVCGYAHMNMGILRNQKRGVRSLELELGVSVSHLI